MGHKKNKSQTSWNIIPEIKIRHNKLMFTSNLLLFAAVANITKFHKAVMVLCHWAIVVFLTLGGFSLIAELSQTSTVPLPTRFFIASG